MNQEELLARLQRIEEAITAKGHPMQDYSTLKMAMIDLIGVVRMLTECHSGEGRNPVESMGSPASPAGGRGPFGKDFG